LREENDIKKNTANADINNDRVLASACQDRSALKKRCNRLNELLESAALVTQDNSFMDHAVNIPVTVDEVKAESVDSTSSSRRQSPVLNVEPLAEIIETRAMEYIVSAPSVTVDDNSVLPERSSGRKASLEPLTTPPINGTERDFKTEVIRKPGSPVPNSLEDSILYMLDNF
jgi:hypothetical protein